MTDRADFGEILDEYVTALESDHPPDREALLARHPELAEELQAALLGIDFVRGASPRLAPGTDTDGESGRSLGDYRLLREVGRGGMAVVYEAEQVSLGRRVALKVLPFAAVLDPKHLQRFKNEAMAAAHLRHKNIVPVYGVGCERGVHYYAMQYVEGQSLAAAIGDLKGGGSGKGARSPISSHGSHRERGYIRMAAALGVQAAEALDHAHELGIVHRDVKPGNLLVDLAGTLWITDFGLSHSRKDVSLTVTGELLGTIRYMSPEQALAKRVPVDHRTDLYSLGATLYELFTLEPAFPGDDPHLVIQDIARKEPVLPRRLNPALPRDLETVILKAMAKDPAARYATAQEMADDLERFLEDRPIEAKRPGPLRRASQWGRRHRALVGVAAGMLLLAVAGLAAGAALLWREKQQTKTAFDRAEANLTLALKALDQIYVDEAQGRPRLREGLSHDLLERGLGFYEDFARANAHNRDVALLKGHAQQRASLIFRELGDKVRAEEALDRAISSYREAIGRWPKDPRPHLGLSAAFLERGDYESAIAACREAIRLAQDNAFAHYNLGTAFLEKGDLDGAIRECREAVRLKPDFAVARLNLGNALSRKGDSDGAIREYREALVLRPDFARAHSNLGSALRAQGKLDEAIREHREAIRLEPNLALAHGNLGNALVEKGDSDGAIASYREAIRLKPDYAEPRINLGNLLLAKGQIDEAIREYRAAIGLKPDHATAHYGLGNALVAKRDQDGAIAAYQEATRLKPDYADAHCNLANTLSAKGNHEAAIPAYRESIRFNPSRAQTHYSLGLALGAVGNHKGAIDAYRAAIRLKPEHADAHVNLGILLSISGDADEAIREYREAIRHKPALVQAHFNLGIALSAKADHEGAIRAFREAAQLMPDRAATHFVLGNALKANGNLEGAVASYRTVIRLERDHADAHNNLGNTLVQTGHHEEAVRTLHEAVRLRPNDAPTRYNLGIALREKGETDAAIAAFREAIGINPDLADAHFNLGLALAAKGEADAAIAAFGTVIRLQPDDAEAHCELGLALAGRGRFQEAVPLLRKGHELGSRRPDWASPSKEWLESAERKAEMEGRLDRVLSGVERPRDAAERILFAEVLYAKSRHAESTRMYVEAFAEAAAAADDLAQGHRYNAACSAAMAAARGGADAAEWRGRALEWLRAELAAQLKAATDPVAVLEHWKRDRDLTAVRDHLDDLPKAEREAWRNLWTAVDRALAAARPGAK
jgi:tetratricopeptide (TPR) repeat protein